MSCKHSKFELVIDQHNGCTVCRSCCRVIDMPYFDCDNDDFAIYNDKSDENLRDICANNFIHDSMLEEAVKIKKHVKSILPKRLNSHIDLFSLYHAGLNLETPYLKTELAMMFGFENNLATRIISSISKSINHIYTENRVPNPIDYLPRLSCNLISDKEKRYIYKKYQNLPIRFNLRHAELFVAAIIYNYKKSEMSRCHRKSFLFEISNRLGVNVRTIKLLDNEIDKEMLLQG